MLLHHAAASSPLAMTLMHGRTSWLPLAVAMILMNA
jgi:hypothetical protein